MKESKDSNETQEKKICNMHFACVRQGGPNPKRKKRLPTSKTSNADKNWEAEFGHETCLERPKPRSKTRNGSQIEQKQLCNTMSTALKQKTETENKK